MVGGDECDLRHLEGLTGLQALVLDGCSLDDGIILPNLPGLKTLRWDFFKKRSRYNFFALSNLEISIKNASYTSYRLTQQTLKSTFFCNLRKESLKERTSSIFLFRPFFVR